MTTMIISLIVSHLLVLFLTQKFSQFRYKSGFHDGRIYEQALFHKNISSADRHISTSFSQEELDILANISKKHV